MRFRWLILFGFVLATALAQSFTGSYFIESDTGGVTLSMKEDEAGKITGALEGNGTSYTLDGEIDTEERGVSYGYIETPEGTLLFEAYLEEPQLYLYVFELNAQGEIDYDNAQEVIFERQSASAATLPTPPASEPANPLGNGATTNPLTQSSPQANTPFAGSYQGDGISLNLIPETNQYRGKMEIGGQTYPVVATATTPETFTGEFDVNGAAFTFSAVLKGNELTLTSDGSNYTLTRSGGNPLATPASQPEQPANPLNSSNQSAPDSPVIAQGQYANLTQDDAFAFIDALEFSLQQVGYTERFSEGERQQLLQGIVQNFPSAEREDQLVMSQAKLIWNNVQANWQAASQQEKETFVIGVFTLAFGEEAVRQNLGQTQSQTSTAGVCSTVETCMSTLNPEAYNDMVATQGCWAAAGCTDYDPSSDTYTYEDYSTPSFDSSGDY